MRSAGRTFFHIDEGGWGIIDADLYVPGGGWVGLDHGRGPLGVPLTGATGLMFSVSAVRTVGVIRP